MPVDRLTFLRMKMLGDTSVRLLRVGALQVEVCGRFVRRVRLSTDVYSACQPGSREWSALVDKCASCLRNWPFHPLLLLMQMSDPTPGMESLLRTCETYTPSPHIDRMLQLAALDDTLSLSTLLSTCSKKLASR